MSKPRRDFLRLCGAVVVEAAVLPELLPILTDQEVKVSLDGVPTTLMPVTAQYGTVAQAQYGYYNFQYQQPYSYFGQYQMWQQWNAYQYQLYMQQMALQHAWILAYYRQMAQVLQGYYSRGFMMSQPFALDSVQSVYSYGRAGTGKEILTGFNREKVSVELEGSPVRLVSAAADVGRSKGWSRRRVERAAAPQSDASKTSIDVNSSEVDGFGFDTSNGLAFASRRIYKDERSGRSGNLVVIDSDTGKEMRLVPLYS